jgi:hypothetical protein
VEDLDHDQRFKTLIQEFFDDFMRLFFARWAERLDCSSPEWLPQEVFPDPPEGPRRVLDLVARLPAREPIPGARPTDGAWLALIHGPPPADRGPAAEATAVPVERVRPGVPADGRPVAGRVCGVVEGRAVSGVRAVNKTVYEQGREEGVRDLLREQLADRFGPLPPEVAGRLEAMSYAQLKSLVKQVLRATSLKDLGLADD